MQRVWKWMALVCVTLVLSAAGIAEDARAKPQSAEEVDATIIQEIKDRQEILKNLTYLSAVSYTHLTLPTIYSV